MDVWTLMDAHYWMDAHGRSDAHDAGWSDAGRTYLDDFRRSENFVWLVQNLKWLVLSKLNFLQLLAQVLQFFLKKILT
jgi:hypothetical protein